MDRYVKKGIGWGIGVFLLFCLSSQSAYSAKKEPLLVLRRDGKDYHQALKGIKQEVEDDFIISEMTRH